VCQKPHFQQAVAEVFAFDIAAIAVSVRMLTKGLR
jgi:hypothetical protein